MNNIREDDFYGCKSLSNITIPDSATSIKQENPVLEDTNTSNHSLISNVREDDFYGCESLSNITIPDTATSITIPEGVTSIEDGAFSGYTGVTSITIPESVTSIGMNAFSYCTNLKEVNWNSPIRPTKELLENIFKDCPNLEAINYHGTRIELNSKNIDDVIKDASVASPDEPVPSLDDIIKTAGEEH